ncbi:MAG: efflux RND transporter periplasmic adaptor subunit [Candidatus Cloacimonetes bacterium]|nr:efflux RND transporter periplasmic adaptor subunit [Candidatus Cloacimonadota bacterium]
MKNRNLYIISSVLLIIVFILASCTSKQTTEHNHSDTEYYTCPMHPTVVQDEEGDCPICGMDLVLEKGDKSENKKTTGSITIDPTIVQNMGVRVKHVSYRDISHTIRTIGKVEIADNKSYSVNLRFSGWIEKIFADKVGQEIRRGEKLFEIYSPELISAQEEYLLAVNTYGKDNNIAKAAQKRLRLWNIPQKHLDKIISENNAQQNVILISPFSGHILHKNIKEGSKVKAGADLYHIGNLDNIWIIADLYEFDSISVKPGQQVTLEFTNLPGKIQTSHISFIYPTLNPKTRTQKIRIELKNPDLTMKPGMFATVRIESERAKNVLTVPTEAIINTGERKIVFISRGNGKFEPREIQTGLADDSNYYSEVISGLEENEIVVVSGQFLMDSESQLQEAVQKLLDAKFKSTLNSGSVDDHDHSGSTYFTCPMHPTIVQDEAGDCPICGMDLIEKEQ